MEKKRIKVGKIFLFSLLPIYFFVFFLFFNICYQGSYSNKFPPDLGSCFTSSVTFIFFAACLGVVRSAFEQFLLFQSMASRAFFGTCCLESEIKLPDFIVLIVFNSCHIGTSCSGDISFSSILTCFVRLNL